MRFMFSVVGFVLFIVGCQSLVPVTERVIELPTREYQRVQRDPQQVDGKQPELRSHDVLDAITKSCKKHGRFLYRRGSNTETYVCYPEAQ